MVDATTVSHFGGALACAFILGSFIADSGMAVSVVAVALACFVAALKAQPWFHAGESLPGTDFPDLREGPDTPEDHADQLALARSLVGDESFEFEDENKVIDMLRELRVACKQKKSEGQS